MRALKLFFTDKVYRRSVIELLKLDFLALPVIKHILALYYIYKWDKRMQGLTQWEQYVATKELENDTKKLSFLSALTCLEACIIADVKNVEAFEKVKEKLLCNELINEPNMKDFKKWLEGINSSEKDYSKVQKVIDSFN